VAERPLTQYEWSRLHPQMHDEVLKLKLIFKESTEPIYPSCILEKLERILTGAPIALDLAKQLEFNRIKRGG